MSDLRKEVRNISELSEFERVAEKQLGLSSATRDSRQKEHGSVGYLFPYIMNRTTVHNEPQSAHTCVNLCAR